MLSRFIARRYLFSPHSRSVVNLISGLSVAAVAVPVAAMVILLSVFNGFETLVKSMYSAFDADLTLTPRRGQTFAQSEIDTAALRRIPGVASFSWTLEQSALLEHGGRQATATVRGVDDSYGEVFDLGDAVTTGEWRVRLGDLERLVIGQSMAWMLGIRTLADADVTLYAVRRGSFSTLLPMDNYTRRTEPVGGVYVLDLDTERTYVLTSLRLAQSLFEAEGRASGLVFRLTPDADVERTREAVSEAAGDSFRVRIALLVLVNASFSVLGALSMLIVEKRRDIATLRALGADTPLLRRIFRTEGLLICGLGAVIGLLLGVALSLVQQYFEVIEIPAETFLTKSYPVELRLSDLFAVAVTCSLVTLLLADVTVRSMIKNTTRS